MTRDKAIKEIYELPFLTDINYEAALEVLIGRIYDDFESRVCGNCKYYNTEFNHCEEIEYNRWQDYDGSDCMENLQTKPTFGCNKFEGGKDVN